MKYLRLLVKAAAILLVGYLFILGGMFVTMLQPPEEFAAIYAKAPGPIKRLTPLRPLWMVARAGGLEVGDPAPDFQLSTFDKKSTMQLSSYRGQKPVVLVFGSYT